MSLSDLCLPNPAELARGNEVKHGNRRHTAAFGRPTAPALDSPSLCRPTTGSSWLNWELLVWLECAATHAGVRSFKSWCSQLLKKPSSELDADAVSEVTAAAFLKALRWLVFLHESGLVLSALLFAFSTSLFQAPVCPPPPHQLGVSTCSLIVFPHLCCFTPLISLDLFPSVCLSRRHFFASAGLVRVFSRHSLVASDPGCFFTLPHVSAT